MASGIMASGIMAKGIMVSGFTENCGEDACINFLARLAGASA